MIFTWIDFYTKFAYKLLEFKNKKDELIKKIIKVYNTINLDIPTIEENNNDIVDIDPFTIYAFFNRQVKDETRKLIIKELNKEFDVNATVPSDFNGIPLVYILKTAFFHFKSQRNVNDIDNLWEMFEIAIKYTNDSSYKEKFIKQYDICQKQLGVKWNLTMGLFWINPYFYINLDSRNRWFMSRTEYFSDDFIDFLTKHHASDKSGIVPTGYEYILIKEEVLKYITKNTKYSNFILLSHEAFVVSEEENKRIKESENDSDKNIKLDERGVHTWIYSPGDNAKLLDEFVKEEIFGIGWDEVKEPNQYKTREELRLSMREIYQDDKSHINDSLCIWQFIHDIQIGDIIIAKKGRQEIVARGIVSSDYKYDETRKTYKSIRSIKWSNVGSWPHPGNAPLKTLTDITFNIEYVNQLNLLFDDTDDELINTNTELQLYTHANFLEDVYMTHESYNKIKKLLLTKKNIILEGAPGVGKSFIAKRLAYSIIGKKDFSKVEYIQFHQSYSYEDFIMGYRPTENGFTLQTGSFYEFCIKASQDKENKYFFIIDEINRGNLNKIFGELFLLLESDRRDDTKVRLLYKNELFTIPSNLYIIGLMNTADRSLAIMDYALRRRFAFYTINPAFDNELFINKQHELNNQSYNNLINRIKELNIEITNDDTLGKGFVIGHSYFSKLTKDNISNENLLDIIEYEIIPLLSEYFYDDINKVLQWEDKLRLCIK